MLVIRKRWDALIDDLANGVSMRRISYRYWQVARRYLIGTMLGLHALHCNGIVHRDIKPENILASLFAPARHSCTVLQLCPLRTDSAFWPSRHSSCPTQISCWIAHLQVSSTGQAKLGDLGMAMRLPDSVESESAGAIAGNVNRRSPEQLVCKVWHGKLLIRL
eukprot:SAG31_NODE_8067_length_1529_cov_1.584615_2_plen_163_part_00